ncbi:MAG: histidine phosphatase family protein [Bacteroidota bacterium]|nr:histidine phosphatase family protein [Bacteroidota bacterium]
MKTLLLVRHAKSSWDDVMLPDFERTLNERGKRDAPAMAKRIGERNLDIDAFISSPAKRAKKTAEIFIKELKEKDKKLLLVPTLYEATILSFYDAVENIKNKNKVVALFSHNPGITDFANRLTEEKINDMPTCGIFAVSINTDNWKDFKNAKKTFLFFDFPKNSD